jgi:hypothetical protein
MGRVEDCREPLPRCRIVGCQLSAFTSQFIFRNTAARCASTVDGDFITDLTVIDLELDEQWSFARKKKDPFAESAEHGEA